MVEDCLFFFSFYPDSIRPYWNGLPPCSHVWVRAWAQISAQTVHDRNSRREDTRRAQEETHDMMPFSPEGPRETTETARRLTGEIKFPGTKKNSRRGEIMATVNVGGLIMRVEMMRNGFEKQDSMNTFWIKDFLVLLLNRGLLWQRPCDWTNDWQYLIFYTCSSFPFILNQQKVTSDLRSREAFV